MPKSLYKLSMRALSNSDIFEVKNNLPRLVYNEFLRDSIINNDDFWDNLLQSMGYRECDIIDWDFDKLSLEQRLLLQHYPSKMPTFASEFVHIIRVSYELNTNHNMCNDCALAKCQYKDVVGKNGLTRYLHVDTIAAFIRDPKQWCSVCKTRALFRLSNGTNHQFFDVFNCSTFYISDFIQEKYKHSLVHSTYCRKNRNNELTEM